MRQSGDTLATVTDMPVLVTGGDSGLGARVLDHLRASRGEVRAYLDATDVGDTEAAALRSQGYKVALGEVDDEGHLEAALEQVHTVAHCWGGPLRPLEDQIDAAAVLASAVLGAGVRRLVWVRELAVDDHNPYLHALDEIGRLFDDLPMETVTMHAALRYGAGDPLTERLAAGWLSGSTADPSTLHAPVALDDVAHAVAVADRQRGGVHEVHVRLALVGPARVTLADFLRRIGAPDLDGPTPAEPPPNWVVDWLSRPAIDVPASDDGTAVVQGAESLPRRED